MGRSEREKGRKAEREVALIYQAAGFEVRGLEALGDHLVVCKDGLVLHSETKRQERLQLGVWVRQAEENAPQGTVPVIAWRHSHMPWRADLALADLVTIVSGR
jgi:Holliday junction resolvase